MAELDIHAPIDPTIPGYRAELLRRFYETPRDRQVALAQRLRADGHTLRAIADALGVCPSTAQLWTFGIAASERMAA